jgi:hypothetical protein
MGFGSLFGGMGGYFLGNLLLPGFGGFIGYMGGSFLGNQLFPQNAKTQKPSLAKFPLQTADKDRQELSLPELKKLQAI